MNLGDQITQQEIRDTPCPRHGQFCMGPYVKAACRARIEEAIYRKHQKRIAASRCDACREGRYHVHFNPGPTRMPWD